MNTFPVIAPKDFGTYPELSCRSFQIIKAASTSLFHKWPTGKKAEAVRQYDACLPINMRLGE